MRIIVTGSRGWDDREAICGALDLLAGAARYNAETLTVVHGAAKGADTIADEWVRERSAAGWPVLVERFPADWTRYGKQAGYIRNRAMVSLGADACVAFVLGASAGATHCGKEAEAAGIRTEWVRRDYLWAPQLQPRPAARGQADREAVPAAGAANRRDVRGAQRGVRAGDRDGHRPGVRRHSEVPALPQGGGRCIAGRWPAGCGRSSGRSAR